MRIYKKKWLAAASGLAVTGIVLALFTVANGVLIAMPVLGAVAGCSVRLILDGQDQTIAPWQSRIMTRAYVTMTLAAAATGLAITGWVAATALPGFAVVAVIAASAPPSVAWICRKLPPGTKIQQENHSVNRSVEPEASTWSAHEALSEPMDHLSDDDVIFAWRLSYLVLLQATSPAELASVIDIRMHCLDEFHRRNPTGFNRWIAAGARAASDPTRYLKPKRNADSTE